MIPARSWVSDIRTGIVLHIWGTPSELVRTSHVFRHALPPPPAQCQNSIRTQLEIQAPKKRNPPAEVSVCGRTSRGRKAFRKQDKNSSPTILVHTDILSYSITDLLDSILSPVTYTSTQRSFLPPTPPPHHTALVCWCPICHKPYQISKDARKKECDFSQFQKSMPDQFYLMRFAALENPCQMNSRLGTMTGLEERVFHPSDFVCMGGEGGRARSRSRLGGIYIDGH